MWKRKTLLWQLYPPFLLVILLSLLILGWYTSIGLKHFYLQQIATDLESRSRLVGEIIAEPLFQKKKDNVQIFCRSLGKELSTRFTVILPSGKVIGDSEKDPSQMDNHSDRPEIKQALSGRVGVSSRYSYTLKRNMMYVAVPLFQNNKIAVVVRSSLPVTIFSHVLSTIYRRTLLVGLIVALGAGLISLVLSSRIQKPIEKLKEGAIRFGEGDLSHRMHVSEPDELRTLGEAMNLMASQLGERLQTITYQRNELKGILSSMTEGVLVVNREEKIVRVNTAAVKFFDINPEEAEGKSIQEVIRNSRLQRFIQKTLTSKDPQEEEFVLSNNEKYFIQTHGTILRGVEGEIIGALVVVNDVTRMKKLENIRREFVANVSHELKTPITAIKGSLETLKEGAIQNPKDTLRFLDIITKNTERLKSIIEDLLSLSKIEQDAEQNLIRLEEENIKDVLEQAVSLCQSRAAEKGIRIDMVCDDKLKAKINPHLLEEAVVNLLDNAVKYSKPNSKVRVEGIKEKDEVIIKVQDWGCGIEKKYLSRIFERFYRVDKARSRRLGGTGLGLAIVKHIAQVHGGSVTVESIPGKGSTFSIHLSALFSKDINNFIKN